jgi:hypothetical protein
VYAIVIGARGDGGSADGDMDLIAALVVENLALGLAYVACAVFAVALAVDLSRRAPRTRRARPGHGTPLARRAFLVLMLSGSAVALAALTQRLRRPATGGPAASPSPTPHIVRGPENAAMPGLWISRDELAALPTDVPAFERLRQAARDGIPREDVSNQDSKGPQRVMAAALVAARLDDAAMRSDVRDAIAALIGTEDGSTGGHPDRNRPLGIGRNLSGYVIAADIIGLRNYDRSVDDRFRSWIDRLRTVTVRDADESLVDSQAHDHSNWGAYISASVTAVNRYLGDTDATAASADTLRGWLGDPRGSQEWVYDTEKHDYSWECHYPDVTRYLPVNPAGCERDGLVIDGIIPVDMQRGGGFQVPPIHTRYPRESLHGRTIQAELLHRAGFATYEWADAALARIATRLLALAEEFDRAWYEPDIGCYRIIARRTGLDLPLAEPAVGRSVAGIDWTVT